MYQSRLLPPDYCLHCSSKIMWSGTVILSWLSSIVLSSVSLRVCYWSFLDLFSFSTPLVLKLQVVFVSKPSHYHRSLNCLQLIRGASSLDHALHKITALSQKRVKDTCFTKSILGLNFDARDSQQMIMFPRNQHGYQQIIMFPRTLQKTANDNVST